MLGLQGAHFSFHCTAELTNRASTYVFPDWGTGLQCFRALKEGLRVSLGLKVVQRMSELYNCSQTKHEPPSSGPKLYIKYKDSGTTTHVEVAETNIAVRTGAAICAPRSLSTV